jgi:hypothetical protein
LDLKTGFQRTWFGFLVFHRITGEMIDTVGFKGSGSITLRTVGFGCPACRTTGYGLVWIWIWLVFVGSGCINRLLIQMYTEQAVWAIAQTPDLKVMVITDDLVMYRIYKTGINADGYGKITRKGGNADEQAFL